MYSLTSVPIRTCMYSMASATAQQLLQLILSTVTTERDLYLPIKHCVRQLLHDFSNQHVEDARSDKQAQLSLG